VKDFFESMYQYLTENINIKTIFNGRIYPLVMPEKTEYPAVVYRHINTVFDSLLQKQSDFVKVNVQFTVYDITYGKAKKKLNILKKVFLDFKGDMSGTVIDATNLITELPGEFDREYYSYILEFEFSYNIKKEGEK